MSIVHSDHQATVTISITTISCSLLLAWSFALQHPANACLAPNNLTEIFTEASIKRRPLPLLQPFTFQCASRAVPKMQFYLPTHSAHRSHTLSLILPIQKSASALSNARREANSGIEYVNGTQRDSNESRSKESGQIRMYHQLLGCLTSRHSINLCGVNKS